MEITLQAQVLRWDAMNQVYIKYLKLKKKKTNSDEVILICDDDNGLYQQPFPDCKEKISILTAGNLTCSTILE